MIRLTEHAEAARLRRGLRRAWIEDTILAPDWTAQDPDPALMRSFKAITEHGGRVIRVVHRRDGDDILVITAHFDRGARP